MQRIKATHSRLLTAIAAGLAIITAAIGLPAITFDDTPTRSNLAFADYIDPGKVLGSAPSQRECRTMRDRKAPYYPGWHLYCIHDNTNNSWVLTYDE